MPGVFYKTPDGIYRVEALDRLPWLEHGFGTRANTLLDLEGLTTLKQIHSDQAVEAGPGSGCIGQGDALISNTPGVRVGVKTADCVPLLVVDARNRVVAAIHAGWRGTAAGIAGKTVSKLQARFGTDQNDLQVAIGPSIAVCCYEVGPEVAGQFHGIFPERNDLQEKVRLDLAEANFRQLVSVGIPSGQIHRAGRCTQCSGEFHSFRRDGEGAGRMAAIAGIKL
jgi:hypothetical protein